jgi:hypothetical protein
MIREELQRATGLDAEVLDETLKTHRGPDAHDDEDANSEPGETRSPRAARLHADAIGTLRGRVVLTHRVRPAWAGDRDTSPNGNEQGDERDDLLHWQSPSLWYVGPCF